MARIVRAVLQDKGRRDGDGIDDLAFDRRGARGLIWATWGAQTPLLRPAHGRDRWPGACDPPRVTRRGRREPAAARRRGRARRGAAAPRGVPSLPPGCGAARPSAHTRARQTRTPEAGAGAQGQRVARLAPARPRRPVPASPASARGEEPVIGQQARPGYEGRQARPRPGPPDPWRRTARCGSVALMRGGPAAAPARAEDARSESAFGVTSRDPSAQGARAVAAATRHGGP